MRIIIYSDDPKIEPTCLIVKKKKWKLYYNTQKEGDDYINIKDLPSGMKQDPYSGIYAGFINCLKEYALHVIKDRWYEAEEFVFKHPEFAITSSYWAYMYAKYYLKSRWPDAENKAILYVNPEYFYKYSNEIIKGRWKEGEPKVMHYSISNFDTQWLYYYAKYVLKTQWPQKYHIQSYLVGQSMIEYCALPICEDDKNVGRIS